jgi:ABC-type antimicrobial peptide transport system permease subunit
VDRDVPLYSVRSGRELISRSVAQRNLLTTLVVLFAALALLVSATGLGGGIRYMVERRSREFGIRIALGASRETVMWSVLRQGFVLTALGMLIGLAGAAAAGRFLRAMLFGVQPSDPGVWAGVVALLAMVTLIACAMPGLRATGVDPAVVLRSE